MENLVINRGNPRRVEIAVLGANGVQVELSRCTEVELVLWINGRSKRAQTVQTLNDILIAELSASELDYLGEYSAQVKFAFADGEKYATERVYLFRVANEFFRTASGMSENQSMTINISAPLVTYDRQAVEDMINATQDAIESTANANNAAMNAEAKAILAQNNANLANAAATTANNSAVNADAKAALAVTATINANTATTNANNAATNANAKATLANTAATNATNAANYTQGVGDSYEARIVQLEQNMNTSYVSTGSTYENNIESIQVVDNDVVLTYKPNAGEVLYGIGNKYDIHSWVTGFKSYALSNYDGVAINPKNNTLIRVVNILNDTSILYTEGLVLVYVNTYGRLVSPFANLQIIADNITAGTKYIKMNGGDIDVKLSHKNETLNATKVGENPYNTSKIIGISPQSIGGAVVKRNTSTFGDSINAYSESIADDKLSTSGYAILIDIPVCQSIVVFIKYKSNKNITCSIYEKNSSGWIGNDRAVIQSAPISSGEDYYTIERRYEQGATQVMIDFGTSTLSPLGVGTQFEVGSVEVYCKGVNENQKNRVIVANSGGEYTSVRAAVDSIKDASVSNQYEVYVRNGTYNEIDIKTKDHIDIIGESKEGVILFCDGLSTSNAPSNYGWADTHHYSGTPINQIPKQYKHLFIHMSNSIVSNMTLIGNQIKYIVHQDNQNNKYSATFDNCSIIRREDYSHANDGYTENLLFLVGVGANEDQFQIYKNCEFILELKNATNLKYPAALYWHNFNNKKNKCGATLDNCKIYNTNIAYLSELGSDTDDVINIINTVVNDTRYGVRYSLTPGYYISEGQVTNDTTKIPYCIRMNIVNSNINYVLIDQDRIGGVSKVIDPCYISIAHIPDVLIGQPISLSNIPNNAASISTGGNFSFAISNSNSNKDDMVYLNRGNVGYALAIADTYNTGDYMYIKDGFFTKQQYGEQVAVCGEGRLLTSNGLLRVIKLIQ